jgi:hypothetical protein
MRTWNKKESTTHLVCVWNELSNRHKPQLLLLAALHGSCSGKLRCICCLLIQRHCATLRGPSSIQKLYPLLKGTESGLLLVDYLPTAAAALQALLLEAAPLWCACGCLLLCRW